MNDLLVQYEGAAVGWASPDGERFAFRYDANWLHRPDAFPISASLPLREAPWPADEAHHFFANLLPEGVAREAICRRLGVSIDNDVRLLAALGDDTAGAFRFIPIAQGEAEPRPRQPIAPDELERWAKGEPAFSVDPERPPRLSLAGAQHKVSVVLTKDGYALGASDEPSTHILKFDSERYPHLTANEFLTTRFAKALGLDVVQSALDDRTSSPVLVVERYDRTANGETIRRVHQEDFCQILAVPPSRKYEDEGGPTLVDVASAIRDLSSRPAADRLTLVRWMIFCAVAGNADGHAKNLSMLYGSDGPMLAPAYDLVCTRAFEHLNPWLAFAIGGQRDPDRLTRDHWTRLADDLSVRARLVFRELERILDEAPQALERAIEDLRAEVGESPAPQHVGPAVRKRLRAIGRNL
jgi:serine/threonine-protein kinase HipA